MCCCRFSIFVLDTLKFEWQCSQYIELNPTCVVAIQLCCRDYDNYATDVCHQSNENYAIYVKYYYIIYSGKHLLFLIQGGNFVS